MKSDQHRRRVLGLGLLAACPWGLALPAWATDGDAKANAQPGELNGALNGALTDAQRYFRPPQMMGAVLSPDGKRLAMIVMGPHGRAMLSVLDLASLKPTVAFSSEAADVQQVVWVNPDRLAFTLGDHETPEGKLDAGPGLFAVDHDGTGFRQLVERQRVWARNGNDTQRLEPWNTYLLNGSTQRSGDEVLVLRPEAFDGKSLGFIRLLRLNTRNGRRTEIEAPLHAVGWWADAQGELRVVLTQQGAQSALRWRDPASGAWKTLSEFNSYTGDGDLQVRHVAEDGRLYVSARRGRDKQALWLLDPATGRWTDEPLAQSPAFDVDAHIVSSQGQVLGWRFTIDAEVTQWQDPGVRALQERIDKLLPRTVNRLSLPWSGKQPWVLVEAFADIQPTLYYLYQRETGKFVRLGAQRPDLDAKQQAAMDMVQIPARDGLSLPAWLSLPRAAKAEGQPRRLPLVVLVHGGPFVRGPSWQFDAELQFLVARGYAVLQPQFRGTQGFGAAHARAGWRQWGKAMQNDLADVARWAIAQGIADPERIAIAGASYGGYASLMGLIRDPELFRCGVAWVGVTDLDMLHTVNWSDVSDDFKRHGLPVVLGDREKDAADLKVNSPLTHAASIRQPLLLAYGGADKRVPLIHGESFRRALSPDNKNVEWLLYRDEGHGWRSSATKVDFWNHVAAFLDKHLAPR